MNSIVPFNVMGYNGIAKDFRWGYKMNGFREGTMHITSGDRMKENDHRRSKSKCLYFDKGVCLFSGKRAQKEFVKKNGVGQVICAGSAHCKRYDDGIRVTKPNPAKCYIIEIYMNNGEAYVKEWNKSGEVKFTVFDKDAARFKSGKAIEIARQLKDFNAVACKIEV